MKTLKKEGIPLSHRHLHGLRSNIILHHKPDPLSSLSLSLFFYLQPLSLLSSHSPFPRSEERKKMAEQLYFYHNQQNENSLLILTILVRTIRVFPLRVGLFFFVFRHGELTLDPRSASISPVYLLETRKQDGGSER
jgi:hypothetical protein